MRKFLLILVIISISLLGCENSLNTSNNSEDNLTYSKVADLYNGAELYYGNYTIKIENDSNSETLCANLCSYPEVSPDGKRIAYIDPDEQDSPRDLYMYDMESNSSQILFKSDHYGSSVPKEVRWLNNQYLLLIIGYGYGHTNYGGSLYVYDTSNEELIPLKTPNYLTEYRDIAIKGDIITLEVVKWTDDNYNDFIIEQENLTYTEILEMANRNITSATKYADLNNDGIEEKVTLTLSDEWFNQYTLKVNNSISTFSGEEIEPIFNIVDIDSSDKYKEIAISEYGPSSDYATTFFYYDNEMLFPMGKIQGFYGDQVKIDGNGKIITQSRGRILQTWFYQDEYRLSDEHRLVNVPKDLYEMNTEVEVNEEFTLQKSRTDATDAVILKKGEKVTILASDNKEWCLVENSQGETGWFAVDNFDTIRGLNKSASEVFNGLNNAD